MRYVRSAPVRHEFLFLLRRVNKPRKAAGLGLVWSACLRLRRAITAPFGLPSDSVSRGGDGSPNSNVSAGMKLPKLPSDLPDGP